MFKYFGVCLIFLIFVYFFFIVVFGERIVDAESITT